jgi:hypothetical protein
VTVCVRLKDRREDGTTGYRTRIDEGGRSNNRREPVLQHSLLSKEELARIMNRQSSRKGDSGWLQRRLHTFCSKVEVEAVVKYSRSINFLVSKFIISNWRKWW